MLSLRTVFGASSGTLRQFLPSFSRHSIYRAASLRPFSHMVRNGLTKLRAGQSQSNNAVAVGVASARQIEQVRGMKTRSSVKKLCDDCKII
ncbi:hypothetical protein NUU61_005415 [Penicillium alfredii]|uniref:Uncharacterized protein n=1 Tax=Penicillium alfredii TaxID=1506179 RepID=A0A9W9K7K3_9EURO|nr:uncharacterized protein NUU61_005415 [Penicillium alfredii]KAJ5096059.1 hypothetical protein NUU61_005415 [Penicillium alfredii]